MTKEEKVEMIQEIRDLDYEFRFITTLEPEYKKYELDLSKVSDDELELLQEEYETLMDAFEEVAGSIHNIRYGLGLL
jgi:hypothetical protein